MDKKVWLSRRALRLHAVILIVVPGFMALCVWQISRAVGGNNLSWAYVFEWPLFAGYAVYMWWRILHEAPDAPASPAPAGAPGPEAASTAADNSPPPATPGETARQEKEDAELAAYNEYLAGLAERDRAAGR